MLGHREDEAVEVAGAPVDKKEAILPLHLGQHKWIPVEDQGQCQGAPLGPTCPERHTHMTTHAETQAQKGTFVTVSDTISDTVTHTDRNQLSNADGHTPSHTLRR